MLIKLTSFFTGNDIYVNVNRISVLDPCKTEDGSVKTRIAYPKPIYVKETPEEILKIIHDEQMKNLYITCSNETVQEYAVKV